PFGALPKPAEALSTHELLYHLGYEQIADQRRSAGSRVDCDVQIAAREAPGRAATVLSDIHRNWKVDVKSDIPEPSVHQIEVAVAGSDHLVGAGWLQAAGIRSRLLQGIIVLELIVSGDTAVGQAIFGERHMCFLSFVRHFSSCRSSCCVVELFFQPK